MLDYLLEPDDEPKECPDFLDCDVDDEDVQVRIFGLHRYIETRRSPFAAPQGYHHNLEERLVMKEQYQS